MYYYSLLCVIKLCLLCQQLPFIANLCLLGQMQVLDTHIWLFSLSRLSYRLYNRRSACEEESSNNRKHNKNKAYPYSSIPSHHEIHIQSAWKKYLPYDVS